MPSPYRKAVERRLHIPKGHSKAGREASGQYVGQSGIRENWVESFQRLKDNPATAHKGPSQAPHNIRAQVGRTLGQKEFNFRLLQAINKSKRGEEITPRQFKKPKWR